MHTVFHVPIPTKLSTEPQMITRDNLPQLFAEYLPPPTQPTDRSIEAIEEWREKVLEYWTKVTNLFEKCHLLPHSDTMVGDLPLYRCNNLLGYFMFIGHHYGNLAARPIPAPWDLLMQLETSDKPRFSRARTKIKELLTEFESQTNIRH